MIVGAEVLIWQENDLSASKAIPGIAVVNALLALILIVGWARFLGHGRGTQVGARALLTSDVGSIHYAGTEPG